MAKILCLIFSLALLSCDSDETVNRDELKLKAIYQEYNVNYYTDSDTINTTVYFRTSAYGAYVKLNDADKVQFKVSDSKTPEFTNLKMRRRQVYFGSKNVPYYEGDTTLTNRSNNILDWTWYDAETDSEIVTNAKLSHPEINSFSHGQDDLLDTMKGDTFSFDLKAPLEEGESLELTISNKGNESYAFYFDGAKFLGKSSFQVTSQEFREKASAKERIIRRVETRRYGNVEVEVETEEKIPVLSSGRATYSVQVALVKTEKIDNETEKDGILHQKIYLPTSSTDINF